jgi:hypothetical protein
VLTIASGAANIVRSARTSNTILGTADKGTFIDITSGTFTQTFTAAATLADGWWCYIRNSGTGDITLDPDASEQIDGLATYVMYPGETRLVQCDGTSFFSVVVASFYKEFTSSGTFVTPPGYRRIEGIIFGGGGGGGGGFSGSNQNAGGGGGGGGGGQNRISASISSGTSITTTIGGGGTAGSAQNTGGGGGTTSFGTYARAYGGEGGVGASSSGNVVRGGGGGGSVSDGTGGHGGQPKFTYADTDGSTTIKSAGQNSNSLSSDNIGFGGGAAPMTGLTSYGSSSSEFGGSGGGSGKDLSNIPWSGGHSVFGATGGGAGGHGLAGPNTYDGSSGGGVGYGATVNVSGASGGSGTNGTNGSVFNNLAGGGGGGGGGRAASGTGYSGGAGAQPGAHADRRRR